MAVSQKLQIFITYFSFSSDDCHISITQEHRIQGGVFAVAKSIFAGRWKKPVKTMVITGNNRNKLRLA